MPYYLAWRLRRALPPQRGVHRLLATLSDTERKTMLFDRSAAIGEDRR